MARSRYFQTSTVQDFEQKDPRDENKSEPQHYLTWNLPLDMSGYAQIDIMGDADYIEHTWQPGDRLDRLANKHYNDDQYWWVIALVNGITYPLGIAMGTVIRIPVEVNTILQKLELV